MEATIPATIWALLHAGANLNLPDKVSSGSDVINGRSPSGGDTVIEDVINIFVVLFVPPL
jgi:hypothetical protein